MSPEWELTFLRAVEEDLHLVRYPLPTETTERIPSLLSGWCRALPAEEQLLDQKLTSHEAASFLAWLLLLPTPTGCGMTIGSTGRTCLRWRSAPSTRTRTSAPRTTSGAMVTRLVDPQTPLIRDVYTDCSQTLLYVASDDSDGRGSNPVMLNEIANYLLTNSWNDKVNYHNKDKV